MPRNMTVCVCVCAVSDLSLSTASLEVALLCDQERSPLAAPLWRH